VARLVTAMELAGMFPQMFRLIEGRESVGDLLGFLRGAPGPELGQEAAPSEV